MKARYVCIEGVEGVGKTTQVQKLTDHLISKGYRVLQTKEPGTHHAPLTMELRNIMLNAKYEPEMTVVARELISQAIRSIHLEKVIVPALKEYDFIIQDRGTLSGISYGSACGMSDNDIYSLFRMAIPEEIQGIPNYDTGERIESIYDDVVFLSGDVSRGLEVAKISKQEFEAGDAIEARGVSFMEIVNHNMISCSKNHNTHYICVDGKNIEQVFSEILASLEIGE